MFLCPDMYSTIYPYYMKMSTSFAGTKIFFVFFRIVKYILLGEKMNGIKVVGFFEWPSILSLAFSVVKPINGKDRKCYVWIYPKHSL